MLLENLTIKSLSILRTMPWIKILGTRSPPKNVQTPTFDPDDGLEWGGIEELPEATVESRDDEPTEDDAVRLYFVWMRRTHLLRSSIVLQESIGRLF